MIPRLATAERCVDAQLLAGTREGVAAAGGEVAWEEARAAMVDAMGASPDEAETWLAKAFGWSTWLALNRANYFKPELPEVGQLKSALGWLVNGPLGLRPEDLRAAVAASPKAYLREPQRSYETALAVAPEEFREPAQFLELVLRDPKVLELTYDCLGSCGAQCARCWRPSLWKLTGGALGMDRSPGEQSQPAGAGYPEAWRSWR
eukprot:CAMPEP_0115186032 /NCGR_PEP_ID=MMETSP0270-20121206/9775_1 /TAXON_ID=71861 /ORGANISM="Scrippsiella trochoidea, Strain CCMP3099" /LENGTH=204 /DNA_ID=CAMNT_0002599149 /DNA_START=197 /DNA_END=811 /DNA_ORIENTATION=-